MLGAAGVAGFGVVGVEEDGGASGPSTSGLTATGDCLSAGCLAGIGDVGVRLLLPLPAPCNSSL